MHLQMHAVCMTWLAKTDVVFVLLGTTTKSGTDSTSTSFTDAKVLPDNATPPSSLTVVGVVIGIAAMVTMVAAVAIVVLYLVKRRHRSGKYSMEGKEEGHAMVALGEFHSIHVK